MSIQVRCSQATAKMAPAIRRLLSCCVRRLHLPQTELSVLITTDAAIRSLNRRYRGQDRPTDILSFGMREQRRPDDPLPPGPNLLGDLVVSWPQVKRQANERGEAPSRELELVLVHGLLHLVGYDHARRPQALRMQAMELALLNGCRSR
jgi:probable rRNA maturation factor